MFLRGPDPQALVSKRCWECSIQFWRREINAASVLFVPIGFRGYDVD